MMVESMESEVRFVTLPSEDVETAGLPRVAGSTLLRGYEI